MAETQRQRQKKQTREKLLITAMKLFSEKGFSNTTTMEIAKAAEVSHGTVFAHFKTQEELLIAVIDGFGLIINARLHELAGNKSNVKEVLEAHIEGLIEFEELYTRLVTECRILPNEVRNTFTIIQSTISFHINEAVEMGASQGVVKNLPVHLIFNGWIGLVHYYIANSDTFSPGESVLKRYGKELVDYYMNLISL